MDEHLKLKDICDKIGYESRYYDSKRKIYKERTGENEYREINVKEIIFTKEFMDLYNEYRFKNDIYPKEGFDVMKHLDNTVEYLAKIIGLI